jgi:Fe-S-cluster containining protein
VKLKIGEMFRGVDRAWLEARGIVIKDGYLFIPSRCQYYSDSLTVARFGRCNIYETRPLICRVSECPK